MENELIDGTLRQLTYTAPSGVWISLYTTNPNDDGSGTEVTGGSYARVDATGDFAAPSGGATSNSVDLTFPQATASWGTVTHFGIHDASSGGNLLYHGALTVSKTVDNGDIFSFPVGTLTVTLQ